jgi:hypothetical protein
VALQCFRPQVTMAFPPTSCWPQPATCPAWHQWVRGWQNYPWEWQWISWSLIQSTSVWDQRSQMSLDSLFPFLGHLNLKSEFEEQATNSFLPIKMYLGWSPKKHLREFRKA